MPSPFQDRPTPTPSTSATKVPTPGSNMTGRSIQQGSSFEDRDALDRPGPSGRKTFPPARRTTSVQTTLGGGNTTAEDSDGTDRGNDGYFDAAVPSPMQFLSQRGRPMSFYDMKEQTKQAKMTALGGKRFSWRSGEMPFNYADAIGDNRYNYMPPAMGNDQLHSNPSNNSAPQDPKEPHISPMRLPWTMWMNSEAKNLFVAALSEWVGTTLFLFFAFAGTQVANAQSKTPGEATTTNATAGFDPVVMLYISLSFGFSLMVNVWVFFRISGGLFNPAVSLPLHPDIRVRACGILTSLSRRSRSRFGPPVPSRSGAPSAWSSRRSSAASRRRRWCWPSSPPPSTCARRSARARRSRRACSSRPS